MHDYLADTLLFQAKNKALSLKFAHSVVHVCHLVWKLKGKVRKSPMYLSVLEPKKPSFLIDFRVMHS